MPKVNEYFYTIQGEGPNAGLPSYLIRFSGCSLHCNYCDTKHAWGDNGNELTSNLIDDIMKKIPEDCHNIIITGGEPSLHFNNPKFLELISKVSGIHRRHIDIETNGLPDANLIKRSNIYETISSFKEVYLAAYNNITFDVSPKFDLSCYPIEGVTIEDVFKYYALLKYETEMVMFISYKIVYDYTQRKFIESFIDERINDVFRNYVYIMPMTPTELMYPNLFPTEYKSNCEEAIEFCMKKNLKYTPRIHIDVYGLERGV